MPAKVSWPISLFIPWSLCAVGEGVHSSHREVEIFLMDFISPDVDMSSKVSHPIKEVPAGSQCGLKHCGNKC